VRYRRARILGRESISSRSRGGSSRRYSKTLDRKLVIEDW